MSFRVLGQVTFFRRMIYDGRSRSLTGAWIETCTFAILSALYSGRSLTGAWIETVRMLPGLLVPGVAPLRGRGLKRQKYEENLLIVESLPYGGVD